MASRRSVIRLLVLCGGSGALSALAQPTATAPPAPGVLAAAAARNSIGTGPVRFGLLLPPRLGPFGRAALAVQFGIEAAHQRDGRGMRIEIIEVDDTPQTLTEAYEQLTRRGATLAIGPLTRNGVTALARLPRVPIATLALNQPDDGVALPPQVVSFSLSTEAEARAVAQVAFTEARQRVPFFRRPRALALVAPTPLARRSAIAFHAAWRELGGEMELPLETEAIPALELRDRITAIGAEVVFLAMGPEQAREPRAAVGSRAVVYGTSQLSVGGFSAMLRFPELDGVRLLEMPWQLQPDHLAVIAYPKAPVPYNVELQRLYAFGIDAFRVGLQLSAQHAAFEIDGVTGQLRFDPYGTERRIDRAAVLAEYRNGVPVPLTQPR